MTKTPPFDAVSGEQAVTTCGPFDLPHQMATYSLYGLRVRSNLPLPLAPIEDDDVDLTIRFDGFIARPDGPPPETMTRIWQHQGEQWLLRFATPQNHTLEFVYNPEGTLLSVRQSYPEWRDTLLMLMSTAMAAALHLQGKQVLHATSLVHNGESFLLMGSSGSGKSTLSAALSTAGTSFHADDIALLSWDACQPLIQAGYPRIKITPEIALILGHSADSLLPVFISLPEYPEKWLDVSVLPGEFHRGPAPLKAIYILSGRSTEIEAPRLEMLPPGKAAITIARHLYGQPWLGTPSLAAMKHCTRIAATTPVICLWLPDALNRLRPSALSLIDDIRSRHCTPAGEMTQTFRNSIHGL